MPIDHEQIAVVIDSSIAAALWRFIQNANYCMI
jgi:hypothetical protein